MSAHSCKAVVVARCRYTLNCGNVMHRAVLQHLQLLAVQQHRSGLLSSLLPKGCSPLAVQPWRNVTVNGLRIPADNLPDLGRISLPSTGVITLDFVMYWVRQSRQ